MTACVTSGKNRRSDATLTEVEIGIQHALPEPMVSYTLLINYKPNPFITPAKIPRLSPTQRLYKAGVVTAQSSSFPW